MNVCLKHTYDQGRLRAAIYKSADTIHLYVCSGLFSH